MKKGFVRLTVDLNEEEYRNIKTVVLKNGNTIAGTMRKGLKLIVALEKEELFLSTSKECSNKIPKGLL